MQVVADPSADEGVTMFRDPFVWKTEDGWEMGVGAAEPDQVATIRRYRSTDGLVWESAGRMASFGRFENGLSDTGEGWECPQILRIDDTEMAIVGAWTHADGPGDVLAFPLGEQIRPQRVDDGQNFYAASVMRDSVWGPLLFGWVTEGREAAWAESAGWSGAISLPRRSWLSEGRLRVEPHPALDALRIGAAQPADTAVVGAQAEIVLPEVVTGRIRLRFSDAEYLDIWVDREHNSVTIDRACASLDDRAHRGEATALDAFDRSVSRPALRILIDGSVIEAFTSAGRVITTRVYPTQAPPWTIEAPTAALAWQLTASVGPALSAAAESEPARVTIG